MATRLATPKRAVMPKRVATPTREAMPSRAVIARAVTVTPMSMPRIPSPTTIPAWCWTPGITWCRAWRYQVSSRRWKRL